MATNHYAYDVFGNMTNEVQNGATIARTYDAFGRPTGYALGGFAPSREVHYAYDPLGRFASVTASGQPSTLNLSTFQPFNFTYTYLPGTDLVTGYTCGDFSRSVSYEPHRDLISAVTNAFNGSTPSTISTISTFDYANDAAGRRISRLDIFDGTVITNLFGYNARSEVTSALMGTNTYGYAYDPIGNRIEASHNAETNAYSANALNQYTSIDTAEPTYDADGNMTSDGRGWHYFWNGENRMVCASNADVVVTYAYDHRGRMVRKEIARKDAEPQSITYTWDGWNIIREALATNHYPLATTYNVWGLDIDGTLQGTGGVGGLLAVIQSNRMATNSSFVVRHSSLYLPAYDANGNTTEYVATNGTIVAHYGYSPFGESSVATGPLSAASTHRFSTKPWCADTGFKEYVYRNYRPDIGRWMGRDPIWFPVDYAILNSFPIYNTGISGAFSEVFSGHPCQYIFVANEPLNNIDLLGLSSVLGHMPGGPWHPPAGIPTKCTYSDSCHSIFKKMTLLSQMIVSHQGWICQAPSYKQNPGHNEELDSYWRAYANCGALWYRKQCPGFPPTLDGSPHRARCREVSICQDGRCERALEVVGKTAGTCVGAYLVYKIVRTCASAVGGPFGICLSLAIP